LEGAEATKKADNFLNKLVKFVMKYSTLSFHGHCRIEVCIHG